MTFIAVLLIRLLDLLKALNWLPPLLARITVGWVFIESGWGKLHHLDKVTGFFTELGLPAPAFQACLVSNTEFIGGVLLLIGLFARFASIPLQIIMVVAIMTAKRAELNGFSDLIGFSEFLYILLLFWITLTGAGLISFDTLLAKKLRKLDGQ